jgi:phosphatidylinositol dimannoside acyltransferase
MSGPLVPPSAPKAGDARVDRLSLAERSALRFLLLAVAVLRLLPERSLYWIARVAAAFLYRALPRRRALARRNLARVLSALDEGEGGGERVRPDDRGIDALLPEVFRHWVLTYLESAVARRWGAAELRRRVEFDDPAVVGDALAPVPPGERGRIFVSLHFGSVELSGLYASLLGGLPVIAPMETVGGRLAAAYFERVRGRFGVSIVPAAGAAPVLQRALEGGVSVGLVADRAVVGAGTQVDLFGAPARLPASPVVLAARSHAPIFVLAMRRTGPGRWRARVRELKAPEGCAPRDVARVLLEQQVEAFEAFIGEAPEQWWTLLFPIWDDGARRTVP